MRVQQAARRVIPILPEPGGQVAAPRSEQPATAIDASLDASFDACSGAESFALMVIGGSMEPEFSDGDIVIIEPEGLACDGSYVLAHLDDDWSLRQLKRGADDGWQLALLNSLEAPRPIADLGPVRGVVIQKSRPGRRRATRRYVD